ncbi:MAG: 50S ribosomal protein L6 [Phycisphaerae bacterium]|nr:50S ribosomal protein L6 [Phycisphaerae bacterium]
MSRIGKKPIAVPKGTSVELKSQQVKVAGPLGKMEMECHPLITLKMDDNGENLIVDNPTPDDRNAKQLHGTMRALIANMVTGVSKGFERKMQIFGTGYNVKEQGGKLIFAIGFCHAVEMKIPDGIKVVIDIPATRGNDVPAKFSLSGSDKHVLGQFAANIRRIRPPEPYKGKGIRYADEVVRRKMGKAFASGG